MDEYRVANLAGCKINSEALILKTFKDKTKYDSFVKEIPKIIPLDKFKRLIRDYEKLLKVYYAIKS